jgi:predicted DsbA family dithiol-disulfide isomerase
MKLKLIITSDIVCVWCYIGVRRLQLAFAASPDVDPLITWIPFELNPDMPPDGINRVSYFEQKFGPEKRREIESRTTRVARNEGLVLDWTKIQRQPNTHKCHILMALAAHYGLSGALHDRLCLAHFAEGLNIGDQSTLIKLASEVGIDKSLSLEALSDQFVSEHVKNAERVAKKADIWGVPHFLVNDSQVVNGAIEPREWMDIFSRLKVGATD